MNPRKLAVRLVPALIVFAIGLLPQGTAAAPNQDSAKGRFTETGLTGETIDFSAQSNPFGFNASGTARFTTSIADPNDVYVGEVTCLRVTGATASAPATASVAGVITKAPPGSFANSFQIHVTDSGKFANAPDTGFGFVTSAPPPEDGACPTSFGLPPVEQGEIIIVNATP